MGVVKGDRSIVRKNSTGSEFINRRINLIEGANVTLTVASDSTDNEVDVTIASTGGGSTALSQGLANKFAYWVNASLISHTTAISYDATNFRLGIGTAAPGFSFEIDGADSSANGAIAAWALKNTAAGGGNWYIRAGATGTNTPAGGFSFSNDSNYWAMFDSAGKLGLGAFVNGPNEQLTINGRVALGFTTGVSNSSGYGKLYVKPDTNLYYLNSAGTEYPLAPSTPLSGIQNKVAYWGTGSTLSGATGVHVDSVNSRIGIGLSTVPTYELDVGGSFRVASQSWTKAYRFRTSGSALDVDFAGADAYLSTYGNADFTGTQRVYLVLKSGSDYASAFKNWEWKTTGDAQQHFISSDGGANFNVTGGAFDVTIQGDTDANLLWTQGSTDRVGVGATAPVEKLTLNGRFAMGFTTGASNSSGYGKLYVKPTDSNLYFLNPAGTEYALTPPATGSGSGTVAGSGLSTKLPYWSTGSTVSTASVLHFDATNQRLGIYTSSPTASLHNGSTSFLGGRTTIIQLDRGYLSTATSGATWSVDFAQASIHKTTISAATVTVWLQNPFNGGEYTLITRQDATGGRNILWPSTVVWAGGTTPTPSSSATVVDTYKMIYDSTDAIYRAVPTLNFAK